IGLRMELDAKKATFPMKSLDSGEFSFNQQFGFGRQFQDRVGVAGENVERRRKSCQEWGCKAGWSQLDRGVAQLETLRVARDDSPEGAAQDLVAVADAEERPVGTLTELH